MLNTIHQLLSEVQAVSESHDRLADATGEKFNIFSILRMESDEVATHSRFIAELLNRKGTHGLKDKFLRLFVDRFADIVEFDTAKSHVITEYFIGRLGEDTGGRIDILTRDDNGHVILIERIHTQNLIPLCQFNNLKK